MNRILELAEKIRDEVNNRDLLPSYFRERDDDWMAFCVAIDTLEDSGAALADYEERGLGESNGEKYLRLYGLFQALFLQQDAIRRVYREYLGSELELPTPSGWKELRDLRNLTVGHPIEYGGIRGRPIQRTFLARITLSKEGFMLQIWDKDSGKDNFVEVNLEQLYRQYRAEAIQALSEVLERIRGL